MQEPRYLPAGDQGLVVEFGDTIDPGVNRRVRDLFVAIESRRAPGFTSPPPSPSSSWDPASAGFPPGAIHDLVPTYRSLLITYDPLRISYDDLVREVEAHVGRLAGAPVPAPRVVEIPTAYGGAFGPDLSFVASHSGLSEAEVVSIHSGTDYLVYMMGFSPGFPYLGGMSERIATPRLTTPRTAIPAGSVGIAQAQTGIYPVESPGGWQLIGRTPIPLFDASRRPPVIVEPGDSIRFVPIGADEYAAIAARARTRPRPTPGGGSARHEDPQSNGMAIEVLDGGMLTTVQDAGRFGSQQYGVPVSGAMDTLALRAANRLVGNEDAAAGLEVTLFGPRLRFLADATIALTGADLGPLLDGEAIPGWKAIPVRAGATLEFEGPRDGARAYLAVAGGILVPPVLGSRSTYLRSKLGGFEGRALRAGDVLCTGLSAFAKATAGPRQSAPESGGARRREGPPPLDKGYGHDHVLRVVPGPQSDRFTVAGMRTLLSSVYTVTPQSDRMGCRLDGPKVEHVAGPDIVSDGSPLGAVQVAGDGKPIVLMADRGTAGGYAKIATVVSVDVSRLAQAVPGDTVRFRFVLLSEAHQALRDQEKRLDELVGT